MTYNYKDNGREFIELRKQIVRDGISIYYSQFDCGKYFFTIRIVIYNGKYFLVKRCNKQCIEIVDLDDEATRAYLEEEKEEDFSKGLEIDEQEERKLKIIFEDE